MTMSRELNTIVNSVISRNYNNSGDIIGLKDLCHKLRKEEFSEADLNAFYKDIILSRLKEETDSFNEHMSQLDEASETYFSKNEAFIKAKTTLFDLLEYSNVSKSKTVLVERIQTILKAIVEFKRQYLISDNNLKKAWLHEERRLWVNHKKAHDAQGKQKIELVEIHRKRPYGDDTKKKSIHHRILDLTTPAKYSDIRTYKSGTSLKTARDLNTKFEQALTSDIENGVVAKSLFEIIISALELDHYFPSTKKPSRPTSTNQSTEENVLFPGADNDEQKLSVAIPSFTQNTHGLKSDNHAASTQKSDVQSPSTDKTLASPVSTKPLLNETANTDTHEASSAPTRSARSKRTAKQAKRLDRTLFKFSHKPAQTFEKTADIESFMPSSFSSALELAKAFISELLKPLSPAANEVVTLTEQKNARYIKPTSNSYFSWLEGSGNNTTTSTSSQTTTKSETENSYIKSLKVELEALKKLCDKHNIEQPKMIDRIHEVLNEKDARFLGRDKKSIEDHVILYSESLNTKLSLKFLSHSKTDADQSPMRSNRTTGSIYLAEHLKDIYEKIEQSCKNHKYNLGAEQSLKRHVELYGREELVSSKQSRKLAR